MNDYLSYKLAKKQKAWEGKVSDFALEKSIKAHFFFSIFLALLITAFVIILTLAFVDAFTGGYVAVSIFLFVGFFFLGRAYENGHAAATDVVAQYKLSPHAKRYFLRLDLESFQHNLDLARNLVVLYSPSASSTTEEEQVEEPKSRARKKSTLP